MSWTFARQQTRRQRLAQWLILGTSILGTSNAAPALAQTPPAWFQPTQQPPAVGFISSSNPIETGIPQAQAGAAGPMALRQLPAPIPPLPTQHQTSVEYISFPENVVAIPANVPGNSQSIPHPNSSPTAIPDRVQLGTLPMGTAMGFSPPPTLLKADWTAVDSAEQIYDAKKPVPTQYPLIEWGRPFYGDGMIAPGGTIFSPFNLTHPTFYVYGDYRVGIGSGRNAVTSFDNLASRLNLDLDLAITSTERFHAFVGPLNKAAQFSQVTLEDGRLQFDPIFNMNPVAGFFEGDLGYMLGGIADEPARFDLPIAVGLMPLFYQNGIWMDDQVTGIAISRNALHSIPLNWSNYDASLFAIVDQLNSPAFGRDQHAGQAVGTAWWIEAYGGYIEANYAFVYDRKEQGRTYHNAAIAFTRRYFDRIGNSVRVIVNAGQDRPEAQRTADGGVVIVENNWITASPLTLVPYLNVYYGWGRPQSLARNALAGGILRNVGITFETDGLNGFPTLDDSAINTFGGAIGVNMLGAKLDKQLILEASLVQAYGSDAGRVTLGNQYGVGARYQMPLSHRTLLRMDAMIGWREHSADLYGGRVEYRWKF